MIRTAVVSAGGRVSGGQWFESRRGKGTHITEHTYEKIKIQAMKCLEKKNHCSGFTNIFKKTETWKCFEQNNQQPLKFLKRA